MHKCNKINFNYSTILNTMNEGPPTFILRQSPRAKSVRLEFCPNRGLSLIVPRNFNPNEAMGVLHKHKHWIKRTWLRIQPYLPLSTEEYLPNTIDLIGINEKHYINYQFNQTSTLRIKEVGIDQLVISGPENSHKIKQYLQRWLHYKAENSLFPWIKELSEQTGMCFDKVFIRNNATRWGSCSAKKHISLNCKLLFLPPELVQHVLLHELCHLVHLNHSSRFWNLLKTLDSTCEPSRKALKRAHVYVPQWVNT